MLLAGCLIIDEDKILKLAVFIVLKKILLDLLLITQPNLHKGFLKTIPS